MVDVLRVEDEGRDSNATKNSPTTDDENNLSVYFMTCRWNSIQEVFQRGERRSTL